jgi:hypothetical protein
VPIVNLLMVTCNGCHGQLRQAMFYEVRTATDTTLLPDRYRQLLPGLERAGRDRQGDGSCLRSGADREADGADDLPAVCTDARTDRNPRTRLNQNEFVEIGS